jgi:hypothetical protein
MGPTIWLEKYRSYYNNLEMPTPMETTPSTSGQNLNKNKTKIANAIILKSQCIYDKCMNMMLLMDDTDN